MTQPSLLMIVLLLNLIPNIYSSKLIGISTCSDLESISKNLNGQFSLLNDIDCTGVDFKPIGDIGNPFTGLLNGSSFRILNLSVQKPAYANIGVFCATISATIVQLNLVNINIVGATNVGGLIGYGENTTITDLQMSGQITSHGNYCGGLIGNSYGQKLLRCIITANVNGTSCVGGLIGFVNPALNEKNPNITSCSTTGIISGSGFQIGGLIGYYGAAGSISNSFSSSTVQGQGVLGGLIGDIASSVTVDSCYATGQVMESKNGNGGIGGLIGVCEEGWITNSYASGKVSGSSFTGGLIGEMDTQMQRNVTNTYAVGLVSCGTTVTCGGLIGGISYGTVTVIDSYFDTQSTNQTSTKSGGEGKTTSEMYQSKTYINWDFNKIWNINEGKSYPWLRGTTTTGN